MVSVRRLRVALGSVVLAVGVIAAPVGVAAAPEANEIVLPGATSAEGIASGAGATFYAGDLFTGDIFRGDLQRGTAEPFIDAPDGRQAGGLKADVADNLLFVAGGFTGQAYVYDLRTGADVATYQFGTPGQTLVNDVTVTKDGAWFTDSFQPRLYFVPIVSGSPGPGSTLTLTGPGADLSGQFNLNGIVATPDGRLIVAHTANAALYTVDTSTGATTPIAGVTVPNVDGIIMVGRQLWAVQNFDNKVTRWQLSPDLSGGVLEKTITNPLFEVPTTAALHGDTLAVVNGKFDTGFPPTAAQYEVILVGK